MLNIIKMDFYRMFKTVSFWASLTITAGMAVVLSLIINLFGMNTACSMSFIVEQAIGGTDKSIMYTIFISIFIHAELKNGFIKNIVGYVKPKSKLVISKLLILTSYIFMLPLIYFIFMFLTFTLVGNNITFDPSVDLFIMMAVELLLYFAFGSIIIMLCIISNSNAFSIAIGIMMSVGIFNILYVVIDYFVGKIAPHLTFSSVDYSLMTNINNVRLLTLNFNNSQLVRSICVGIAFSVAAIILSVIAIQKKDIK